MAPVSAPIKQEIVIKTCTHDIEDASSYLSIYSRLKGGKFVLKG